MKSQRGYLSGSFPMVIATYLGCEQTVFYLENALIILTGKIAVLQWDNGWERENWNIFHSCELHSFVPPVPESVPLPHVLLESSSITPGWCNVTLECRAPGNTEDLNVTWESRGLPRELEWGGTPGPAPSSWGLHVNLSPSQPSASLTCVASN